VGELYEEAFSKYDAGDYDGALDIMNRVLGERTELDGDWRTRGNTLLNIARIHERLYEQGEAEADARAALSNYNRVLEEGASGRYDEQTMNIARSAIVPLQEKLTRQEEERQQADQPTPKKKRPRAGRTPSAKKDDPGRDSPVETPPETPRRSEPINDPDLLDPWNKGDDG
jgi:hypothetical protein